jgi:mannose-6-phosphate isomerase-like protein (cupin superfamily)
MHPTLPTLLRIALVFSVDLNHFFAPEPTPVLAIVRKRQRLRFPDAANERRPAYYFESWISLCPSGSYIPSWRSSKLLRPTPCTPHEHPGTEFLYVITGKLELHTGDERHELSEGDTICFDSTVPHSYNKIGTRRTTAIVVTGGS